MMAWRLFLAALAVSCASDAHADQNATGERGPMDYPEPMRLGWGSLTERFTALASSASLGSAGLPLPKILVTQVHAHDGTPLETRVIIPYPIDQKRSTVICRSPYGPFSSSLASLYNLQGFVAVMQDDRGTFSSGGNFTMFRTAADDGVATIEWILKQPWSNGEVYSVGVSADGMGEIALLLQKPPSLKGQWWGWTTGNGHHFVFPEGVYRQDLLEHYMDFLSLVTHGVSKKQTIPALRAHEAWSGWWYNLTDCRSPAPCHFKNVNFPVVSTAGWWDIFSQTQLDDWNGIRKYSDPSVRDKHVLFVGPLGHCAMDPTGPVKHPGQVAGETASLYVSSRLAGEFFSGDFSGPVRSRIGRINLFVMGQFDKVAPTNWWTSLDEWPAFTTSTFYLQGGKSLGHAPSSTAGSVSFEYNPSKPTPMLGGGNIPFVAATKGCGTAEQLSREKRSDVLVFDSEELKADVAVVGQLTAKLFVSSSRSDTDFIVTVSDFTPGFVGSPIGEMSMLVRYGAVRMRWRHGSAVMSAPMSPGKVYEIDVNLMTVAYIFPKGHRIRVAVSSAAAPFYNPNFNTGKSEVADSSQKPLVATNTIHFSSEYPSSVSLPVVDVLDIPPNKNFPAGLGDEETAHALHV